MGALVGWKVGHMGIMIPGLCGDHRRSWAFSWDVRPLPGTTRAGCVGAPMQPTPGRAGLWNKQNLGCEREWSG